MQLVATRPDDARVSARAFRQIFALVLVVEYWARAVPKWNVLEPSYSISLVIVTLAGAVALTHRYRPAFAAVFAVHAAVVWNEFPATGNHAYLELFLCGLIAHLDDERPEEAALLRASIKWVVAVVFFYSGLQKVVHGYYFDGSMLAYSVDTNAFRPLVQLLVPAPDYDRLTHFRGQVGDGPYTSSGPLLALVANATWMTELALPLMLWWQRTSRVAAVAAIVFLLVIEIAAREFFFGLVFINAIWMFLPAGGHRGMVPLYVSIAMVLLASRLGLLGEITFY